MTQQSVILLIDDDENDRILVSRIFVRAKLLNPIVAVGSGEEAIDYLSGQGKYSNRAEFPLPGLILLDLKMPGMDGFDVLRWIRTQPGISTLRVVSQPSSNSKMGIVGEVASGSTYTLADSL